MFIRSTGLVFAPSFYGLALAEHPKMFDRFPISNNSPYVVLWHDSRVTPLLKESDRT